MRFREHGPSTGDPTVVVLHGGPGAPGSVGALARLLSDPARVLEPFQQASSVAQHIADHRAFIAEHCRTAPILVGHSWGAMLALAFAAAHPSEVAALCLVGCGTFDVETRAVFKKALNARLPANFEDLTWSERLPAIDHIYTVDPLPDDPLDHSELDEDYNETSWNDMLRLQADGTYPASLAAIRVPVLMLHGDLDPHPGALIRDSLAPYLPQLEYRELAVCGHYPWRERAARADFVRIARAWISLY